MQTVSWGEMTRGGAAKVIAAGDNLRVTADGVVIGYFVMKPGHLWQRIEAVTSQIDAGKGIG